MCIREKWCVWKNESWRCRILCGAPIPWTKLTLLQLLLLSNGLVCSELQQSWLYLKLSPSTHQRGKIAWYCCGILLLPLVLKTQKRHKTGNKEVIYSGSGRKWESTSVLCLVSDPPFCSYLVAIYEVEPYLFCDLTLAIDSVLYVYDLAPFLLHLFYFRSWLDFIFLKLKAQPQVLIAPCVNVWGFLLGLCYDSYESYGSGSAKSVQDPLLAV